MKLTDDMRRKYLGHALDDADLRQRVTHRSDYSVTLLQLTEASQALAQAKAAMAQLWDEEAAKMLGRNE